MLGLYLYTSQWVLISFSVHLAQVISLEVMLQKVGISHMYKTVSPGTGSITLAMENSWVKSGEIRWVFTT